MTKKKKISKIQPETHDALSGFDIKIDEFGQVISNIHPDKLNTFLDQNVYDKKLNTKILQQKYQEEEE